MQEAARASRDLLCMTSHTSSTENHVNLNDSQRPEFVPLLCTPSVWHQTESFKCYYSFKAKKEAEAEPGLMETRSGSDSFLIDSLNAVGFSASAEGPKSACKTCGT
jgi:hypothetical protein